MRWRVCVFPLCFVVMVIATMASSPALSETGRVNLHLEGAPALTLNNWQRETLGTGLAGGGRLEYVFHERFGVQLGVLSVNFSEGDHPTGYRSIEGAQVTAVSVGGRFRILNDDQGYLWSWGHRPDHTGNWWGNLWVDLHGDYFHTGGEHRAGADLGIGAEFSLLNGLQIGPFIRMMYVFQPDSTNNRDSADALVAVAGLSLSAAYPFAGRVIPDSDGDGLYDPDDRCPNAREDRDGFEDSDGCPEEDNDRDSVLDGQDRCPTEAEDVDGFKDEDGCPEEDNDGDGILDVNDRCPDQHEDMDGFEDGDGCPELDNDLDGVLDDQDQCPDEDEILNDIEDEDGCPEPDQDRDGFVDLIDKCPKKPETINGVEDDDGCPDRAMVEVKDDRILGGDRIFFDFGMARITSASYAFLEELARLINTHPEFTEIVIVGHTDEKGKPDFNYKLSLRRARRVRSHLIGLNVAPARLRIEGFGESVPYQELASYDNDGRCYLERERAENSRQKSRRVELIITAFDESQSSFPVNPQIAESIQRKAGGEEGE